MNVFRTEIQLKKQKWNITHNDSIMLIGSCFAEDVGKKLQFGKFNVEINPFGILFNPISISTCLKRIAQKKYFTENDLDFHHDLWFSFLHHGDFAHENKKICLENINQKLENSFNNLLKTKYLILTLGSAFAYFHKTKKYIVSNCHKVEQNNFNRILLDIDSISQELIECIFEIRKINKNINIIFTISPIRYVKYDFTENMLSKSHLIAAVHRINKQINDCEYFPSYEIMMDDLRDYRFYQSDMIHPNELAIDYIWQKFSTCYFDTQTQKIIKLIQEINTAKQHIFKRQSISEQKKFKETMLKKIAEVENLALYLNFTEDKKYFNNISNE